ncbi:hypothetical protein H2248_008472 [Termitomyces sp. 'cryptogamus']|nr:hypothetical protein H2248_008472 [Termitomyces sp. 'cryptogamus']
MPGGFVMIFDIRDRPSFMNIGLCTGTSRQPIHSSIMVLTTKTPSVSRYARKTN